MAIVGAKMRGKAYELYKMAKVKHFSKQTYTRKQKSVINPQVVHKLDRTSTAGFTLFLVNIAMRIPKNYKRTIKFKEVWRIP